MSVGTQKLSQATSQIEKRTAEVHEVEAHVSTLLFTADRTSVALQEQEQLLKITNENLEKTQQSLLDLTVVEKELRLKFLALSEADSLHKAELGVCKLNMIKQRDELDKEQEKCNLLQVRTFRGVLLWIGALEC